MGIYPRVVVGIDGSEDSANAVTVACDIAARAHVPITLIAAFAGSPNGRDRAWAEDTTSAAADVARQHGITDITSEEVPGRADEELSRVATELSDALLVVGGRGLTKTSSRVSGSVSNRLSHHSAADVLFARDTLRESGATVGLATDGSTTSRVAVRRGLDLATAIGATPHLVTVAKDQEEGERLMGASIGELQFDSPEVTPERDILIGVMAAKALVDAAPNYDIMVIGNRGMSGASRLLGSIANKVTHGAEGNLLLVNTSADTADAE